jgi:hypothetical protein
MLYLYRIKHNITYVTNTFEKAKQYMFLPFLILLIYVMNKDWLQVALLASYLYQSGIHYLD